MTALLAERLRQRVRLNGSAPLLTYYDLASGERTELSAISFSNWVDKTSNLLVDELAVDEGDVVSMPRSPVSLGSILLTLQENRRPAGNASDLTLSISVAVCHGGQANSATTPAPGVSNIAQQDILVRINMSACGARPHNCCRRRPWAITVLLRWTSGADQK